MHHYFEAITNTSGDSLVGYFARVIDPATQNTITMSADDNGTPIVTKSGVDNMGSTDDYGNLDFYVAPGTYHLDIYAPNATSFIFRVPNVAMNSSKGDKGDPGNQGDTGPANSTFATKSAIKAAPVGNLSYILSGPNAPSVYAYIPGTFAYADDYNVLKQNDTPLGTGALVGGPIPLQIADRAVLTALINPVAGMVIDLAQPGREGRWVFRSGNYAYQVGSDPNQGVFMASAMVSASSGAWVRVSAGPMMTAWFGVIHDGDLPTGGRNPTPTDNHDAYQAACNTASALQRQLLWSSGTWMCDGNIAVSAFLVVDGGGKNRGSTLYMKTGSNKPFYVGGAGTQVDCAWSGHYVSCNKVAGANFWDFDARGAVNAVGGLWYSRFRDNWIENCGGIILKLWTGTVAGDYVHQFLTIENNIFIRGYGSQSRCISMAGRVAQTYMNGCNQFDATGRVGGQTRVGCNVVIGRRYAEGDFYSQQLAGGTSPALSNPPAVISIEATIQGEQYGILTDAVSALFLHNMWFESIERSITMRNGSKVYGSNIRCANAGSDQLDGGNNVGSGWCVGKGDTSRFSVLGFEQYGAVNGISSGGGIFRNLDGSTGGWNIQSAFLSNGWTDYTNGIVATASITGGVLRANGTEVHYRVTDVATFTALEANMQPGTSKFFHFEGAGVLTSGSNVDTSGRKYRFRAGDCLEIFCTDSGNRYRAIPHFNRLEASTTPDVTQMEIGEFVFNTAPAVATGKILLGWAKTTDSALNPCYVTNT